VPGQGPQLREWHPRHDIPVTTGSKLCHVCCTAHLASVGDQSYISSQAADCVRAADEEHYGVIVL
jgi:hypothetical protein